MNHVSNSILVFGGFPGDNNEIYELSLENHEWTQINTSGVKPKARFGHGTFINHENLYIFGGEDQHGNKLNDLHSLNLETYEWNEISALGSLPAVRSGHSTKVHKHLMFLFGGERGGSGISLFKT
jgi:N-acetylneuraminic acid mutarotase